jgi:predicted DNA-binding WGR domain protein
MINKSEVERDPVDSEKRATGFRAYARFVSIDPTRNRFRYYSLNWQPGLWGGGALIRTWGRIGTRGRTLETFYDDRASAQELIQQLVRRRFQHGYSVVDAR